MTILTPQFPPLLKGLAAGPANPVTIACKEARRGIDAGLLPWSVTDSRLRAALVLAPEEPLETAMAAFVACGVALQNALGVSAPPETGVHFEWTGGIRVNGGHAGGLHVYGSTDDPAAVPDWLVVAFELFLRQEAGEGLEPGQTPDWTSLLEEGCGELDALELLEGWARHSLYWLNGLETEEGRKALYREWEGLVWHMGENVSVPLKRDRLEGRFLGVDENFGMILKRPDGDSRLIPLTEILEEGC